MMRRLLSIWLCSLALTVRAESPASAPLAPSDFAYGRAIELGAGDSPLVQVALPLDVYRASRSPDLQDVRVFNAQGDEVPHAVRQPEAMRAATTPVPLALFPIPAAQNGKEALGLAIDVQRSADGEVLRLISKSQPAAARAQPIAAYLLDARALETALVGIRFTLGAQVESLILALSISTSNDLVSFRELDVSGALVHLEHTGQRVERDLVQFEPTRAAFYRVRSADGRAFAPEFSIVSAAAEPAPLVRQPARERVVVIGQETAAHSGVYRFDLAGAVPATHLTLELAEDNAVIQATLYSAETPTGPYQRLADERFYRFAVAGKSGSGPEIVVPRLRARYYELRVDNTRPGLGKGPVRLNVEHAPEQLLFLRRGPAPFTLAYGRHGVERQRFEADDLIALVGRGSAVTPLAAALAARRELAGVAVLKAPKSPPPYKTYALWFVLICGVGLLALLAYRLVRTQP